MRATPAAKAAVWSWRSLLMGLLVVAMAMVGLGLLAEAMDSGGRTVYLANITAPTGAETGEPSIVVTGLGRATAPPERAAIQLLFMSDGGYVNPSAQSTPAAETPEEALVQPVIASLLAKGVDRGAIAVIAGPSLVSQCFGPGESCLSVRIDFTVDRPTLDVVSSLVGAADKAGRDGRLQLVLVGASYSVADCRPLEAMARERAVEDARRRAADPARVMGVALGERLVVTEAAPPALLEADGCPALGQGGPSSLAWFGSDQIGLTVPAFDPAAEPEAVAEIAVTLAYAMVDD